MHPAVDCFPWAGDSRRTLYKNMQTVTAQQRCRIQSPTAVNFMVLSSALHKGKRIKENKMYFHGYF